LETSQHTSFHPIWRIDLTSVKQISSGFDHAGTNYRNPRCGLETFRSVDRGQGALVNTVIRVCLESGGEFGLVGGVTALTPI